LGVPAEHQIPEHHRSYGEGGKGDQAKRST
jgi:hypothetical protein